MNLGHGIALLEVWWGREMGSWVSGQWCTLTHRSHARRCWWAVDLHITIDFNDFAACRVRSWVLLQARYRTCPRKSIQASNAYYPLLFVLFTDLNYKVFNKNYKLHPLTSQSPPPMAAARLCPMPSALPQTAPPSQPTLDLNLLSCFLKWELHKCLL